MKKQRVNRTTKNQSGKWIGKSESTRDCSPSEAELIETCSSREKQRKGAIRMEKIAHNTVASAILLIHVTATAMTVNCQAKSSLASLFFFCAELEWDGLLQGRANPRMLPSCLLSQA
jgi:hypothetical protein